MNRKLILKSPRFDPFRAILAQLEYKYDTPGANNVSCMGARLDSNVIQIGQICKITKLSFGFVGS